MILETDRLILRPFTESDAADAFEYLHEPMVLRLHENRNFGGCKKGCA